MVDWSNLKSVSEGFQELRILSQPLIAWFAKINSSSVVIDGEGSDGPFGPHSEKLSPKKQAVPKRAMNRLFSDFCFMNTAPSKLKDYLCVINIMNLSDFVRKLKKGRIGSYLTS
jgi:hypothetical protein